MKAWTLAFAAALALAATSASAHSTKNTRYRHVPDPTYTEPLGPIGLDGAPPSPLCRASLGAERVIHCLHNMIWHGGMYYIDDLKGRHATSRAAPRR